MKIKRVMTVVLLVMLSACLLCGRTACGDKAKAGEAGEASEEKAGEASTVVGNWTCVDNEKWTIGFTEDGDFYDSLGTFMTVYDMIQGEALNYGSWRIRADGNLWFTGTLVGFTNYGKGEHSWGYSYELDGDTLKIGGETFTRTQ